MGINNLPGSGISFHASTGAGNFNTKFKKEVLHGELQNLANNKDSILKVIKKFERPIKMGSFDAMRRSAALSEIKKLEGARFNKQDAIDTKKLLSHLSERPEVSNKVIKISRINKAEDPNSYLKAPRMRYMAGDGPANHLHSSGVANSHALGVQPRSGSYGNDNHGSGIAGMAAPSSADLKPYEGNDKASRKKAALASLRKNTMAAITNDGMKKMSKNNFQGISEILIK